MRGAGVAPRASRPWVSLLLAALLFASQRAGAQDRRGARDSLAATPVVTLEDSLALLADDARFGLAVPAACPVVPMWANLEWQWRGTPTAMLDAVRRVRAPAGAAIAGDSVAFERVAAMQRDPIVANRYRSCHEASPAVFWRLALTAASPHAAQLDRCLGDLDWQRGADPGSLRSAARHLDAAPDPVARNALLDDASSTATAANGAMTALLGGQWRNPRAMERYRACFRDAPEALLAAVRARAR